jgi:hypothetical protein
MSGGGSFAKLEVDRMTALSRRIFVQTSSRFRTVEKEFN